LKIDDIVDEILFIYHQDTFGKYTKRIMIIQKKKTLRIL